MFIPFVDDFLNKITMYRLMLYSLMVLWCVGLVLSILGIVPFKPADLIISLGVILVSALLANGILEMIFNVPSNTESTYITVFILALVSGPETLRSNLLPLVFLAVVAMASKYIIAINRKHFFNPAAFAMVAATYLISYYPSWWIGQLQMIPFVLVAGFLIVRKIQREDLVLSFLVVFILVSQGLSIPAFNLISSFKNLFVDSPILFFSFIMLTEPMTMPPTRNLRIMYGALVGFLLAPFVHIGMVYFTAESALLVGNLFSFIVSPKLKLSLTLKDRVEIAENTYDFIFLAKKKVSFEPGQYMEWTLGHPHQDARGMRRYFTVASSPTENDIRIGVKFYQKPSSYKQTLDKLQPGDQIIASQLAGDFTLPKNPNKKLVFLAGGIGITPFRSMVKYLIDTNQKRDIILFYAANSYRDIAYGEVFKEAGEKLGMKTIYVFSNTDNCPPGFNHQKGFVDMEMVKNMAPDFKDRTFYMSGPRGMITSFEKTLRETKISPTRIKTDFFPGY
ncbi:RnfABCDGE type electron transport complex subunit D [Candidatus Parcubacteria bacterium]|nr:RnfABCDGE type electron transport complex subunit D [Candidatus Parcubacteria bacterium]